MNKIIKIDQAKIENDQLKFITNEVVTGLIAKEHILVDSDHFSFIYLMEENNDYTYIAFGESVWPTLSEALNRKLPAYLISGEHKQELLSFQKELEYVINNIKGNGNYGEEMVGKVEKTFLEV